MPIYRITASADTTITNNLIGETTKTAEYANIGAADSLEIYSAYHKDGQIEESQKSRILIKFPLEKITELREKTKIPQSGSAKFYLKLFNVQHSYTAPNGYTMLVQAVSGSWQEGRGLDLDNYTDEGITSGSGEGVNWVYRDRLANGSSVFWGTKGGDFYADYSAEQVFTTGLEDLNVDITNFVEDYLSGVIENNGYCISLSGTYENPEAGKDFYTKRFSARSTEYFFSRPLLEVQWAENKDDRRNNFYLYDPSLYPEENSGSIYFYNSKGGILRDLPGDVVPEVRIFDEAVPGTILNSGSSTKVDTGIYKYMFSLEADEEFDGVDEWYSGSVVYKKDNVTFVKYEADTAADYIFKIINIKQQYEKTETAILKIYSRKKNWQPNIYSIAHNNIENIYHDNLYYKIIRIEDEKTIIDYGIEPVAYTKCGISKDGNYMSIDMQMLEPDYMYGIKFALVINGEIKESQEIFKFRVK